MARVMMQAVSEQLVTFPGGLPQPGPRAVDAESATPRLAALDGARLDSPAPESTPEAAPESAPDATPRAARTSGTRPITRAIPSTDQARLAELVNAHFRVVWRTLRRLGLNEADSDDGAQQVFLIVAHKLDVIVPGKERSFLVGVSYRVAANTRRAVEKHRHEPFGPEHGSHGSIENPEQLLERRQTRALLDEVLETMPLPQRSVFVLFELEGMTTPEIAESLELPLGTAASRLRRARELFLKESKRVQSRMHLAPEQGGEP